MEDIKMAAQKALYAQLKPELDAAFSAAMSQMGTGEGPQVQRLAQRVAEYLRVPHAIPCADGTNALQLALQALDLPAGAEVIVPAFSDGAAAAAALRLGLKPVFADVLPDTFALDPAAAAKVITPATAAVVPIHLFGQCAPLQELLELARQRQLNVVEDAGQALGASYLYSDGQEAKAGSMGDSSCTSFFPAKPLAGGGEGAAVLTHDAGVAAKAQRLLEEPAAPSENSPPPLDALQAALLEVKINYIDEYNAARQGIALFYDKALAGTELVQVPQRARYSTHIYQQYAIRVAPGLRDGLQEHLRQQHIPTAVYYPRPLHLQDTFAHLHYHTGDFPVAERLSQSVLSLPLHSDLKEDQLTYICEHILDYVQQYGG